MRLFVYERVAAMNAQRARDLDEAGRELRGFPNLAKMARSHAVRLSRDITFATLGMKGTLHDYSRGSGGSALSKFRVLMEQALFAQGPPIYGGSDQIQRNVVGEVVLGLARDQNTDTKVALNDLPTH